MKIALECKSLLLQDSLRFYLSNHLCDIAECDFVISDYLQRSSKPVYFLSTKNKTLPFLPDQLQEQLLLFYETQCKKTTKSAQYERTDEDLREEIQALLMEFSDRFLQVIKKYK